MIRLGIECDLCGRFHWAASPQAHLHPHLTRRILRERGWRSGTRNHHLAPSGGPRDYCPKCAKALAKEEQ